MIIYEYKIFSVFFEQILSLVGLLVDEDDKKISYNSNFIK